jgi:hypothetical protein
MLVQEEAISRVEVPHTDGLYGMIWCVLETVACACCPGSWLCDTVDALVYVEEAVEDEEEACCLRERRHDSFCVGQVS